MNATAVTIKQDKWMAHATSNLINKIISEVVDFNRSTLRPVIPLPKLAKWAIPASKKQAYVWELAQNKKHLKQSFLL
jgi:hypothetical protein